jgi:hypothetical protein
MMKDMVDHWDGIKGCNSMAAWMTAITAGFGIFVFVGGLVLLIVCRSHDHHE